MLGGGLGKGGHADRRNEGVSIRGSVCQQFKGTKGWSKSDTVQQKGSVFPAPNVNIRCPNRQRLLLQLIELFVSNRKYDCSYLLTVLTRKKALGARGRTFLGKLSATDEKNVHTVQVKGYNPLLLLR